MVWLAIFAFVGALACAGATAPEQSCLAPGTEATQQFISFDIGAASYCLRDVLPDSTYELRISYPATQPTLFKLSLEEGDALDPHMPGSVTGFFRSLLDTEKLVFTTDSNGDVLYPTLAQPTPIQRTWLRVVAQPLGVSHSVRRAGTSFNLALDAVHLGFIPATARPIIGAAGLTVIVMIVTASWLVYGGWFGAASAHADAASSGTSTGGSSTSKRRGSVAATTTTTASSPAKQEEKAAPLTPSKSPKSQPRSASKGSAGRGRASSTTPPRSATPPASARASSSRRR
jgi:hypothetical protein